MTISRLPLLKGTAWTVGAFGFTQLLRLATNIALTRLLAPELFGIMQIVSSLRTGVELISDFGLGQSIIYHKDANDPEFYNVAWTLQLIRGIFLSLVFCVVAVPVARFYESPILALVMPIIAFAILVGGFASISRFLLQKRMRYSVLTTFDAIVALLSSAVQVVLAYFSQTIWALVFGTLAGITISTIGSYFILPEGRHRFVLSKHYAAQILSFGKWIFVSSIIYFLSTNFDRLYLAKAIPLELLGVYGIARGLSELLSALVAQLGSSVIFPFIASHVEMPRAELRTQLAPIRMKFLFIAGLGFSFFAASADLVIKILFDYRYQAASWMLPVLIIGTWFASLSYINESTLWGLGRPRYSALANGAKFAFLLIGLTLSVSRYGVMGGVMVVAASDVCRYAPIFFGQVRERVSFGRQDVLITLALFGLLAFWEWLRWSLGFGTSFDSFPIRVTQMLGMTR